VRWEWGEGGKAPAPSRKEEGTLASIWVVANAEDMIVQLEEIPKVPFVFDSFEFLHLD
jgi:hypothetical protein